MWPLIKKRLVSETKAQLIESVAGLIVFWGNAAILFLSFRAGGVPVKEARLFELAFFCVSLGVGGYFFARLVRRVLWGR